MIWKNKRPFIITLCGCALVIGLSGWGSLNVSAASEVRRNGSRRNERTLEYEETQEERAGRREKDEAESGVRGNQEQESEERKTEEGENQEKESKEPERLEEETEEPESEGLESQEQESQGEQDEEKDLKGKAVKESEFGGLPYFRDDTGSNTQLVDGWLYGYWSRQLCRVNVDTLETEVLYEAVSPQNGIFNIYDGYVYFVEQPNVSYQDGAKANLLRVKCEGSEPEVLAEISNAPEYGSYGINIYDDILYLTYLHGEPENYRFFRLSESGEAKEISVEETLYGMLPEGYTDASEKYKYDGIPNLIYCVSHFDYAFVSNDMDRLYRINLETGNMEAFPLPEYKYGSFSNLILTSEALIYTSNGDVWYSINLDSPGTAEEIGELDGYEMNCWDEKGIYYVDRGCGKDEFSVVRLGWDGERENLRSWVKNPRLDSSVYGDYLNVLYSDGTYLYYDCLKEGDGVICRIPLEGDYDDEAEQVFVYYDNPVKDISTRETFATTFTVEDTGDIGAFSITKVYLTEETKAAEKINEFLEEQYRAEEEYIASLLDEVRDMAFSEWKSNWSNTIVEDTMSVSIDYIDDDYIGFCIGWYQYWNGAAHGSYGSVEYVFSRATGERMQITDVVKNSEEEICAIIAPYIEAKAEWGTDGEGWEEIILDDGRFYLTTEGIGIHFDVYEMTCYAAGALDVIVPYEEFELRSPEEVGLMRF